ncbi:hypothetical protein FHR47_003583 [Xanthomonas arboricola]|nr:hypothetical protein [Xanthomonas cannabis]
MSRAHREQRLARCALQTRQQHQPAGAAFSHACGGRRMQISRTGLLFPHFSGSQP